MDNLLEKLSLKHQTWINVVQSFGCDRYTAEDVVQEMYIKLDRWNNSDRSIIYENEELNYYFVFKALRSIYLNYVNKEKKHKSDQIDDIEVGYTIPDSDEHIRKKIEHLHWYDQKIFDLVFIHGYSMLELSKLTNISYHSIKRTCARMKKIIKD